MNLQVKEGLKDSVPFGVGFIPLYLSIGMLAYINGISLKQVIFATIAIFSTPLQFIYVQSINHGYILIPVILTLNARFLLMSATLAPFFKRTRLLYLALSSVLIVPSVLTGCVIRFKKYEKDSFLYFISLGLVIYVVSILSVLIGFFFADHLQSPIIKYMIVIVLPLQFTALAAKHWPDYIFVATYWCGFLLAPIIIYFLHMYALTIGPFIIGGLFLMFDKKAE